MTNRREFLNIGMLATAAAFSARSASASFTGGGARLPIYAVVYDGRFADSIEFGRRSEAFGMPTRRIDGDMTAVWYEDFHPRWLRQPIAIAGLTGRGALFCFEQLARDYRMRVIFRAEHRPTADGRIEHRLRGPAAMVADALAAGLGDGRLPASLAATVARATDRPAGTRTARLTSTGRLDLSDAESALMSWVIAPRGSVVG